MMFNVILLFVNFEKQLKSICHEHKPMWFFQFIWLRESVGGG